jgi:hypothetical protein
MMPDRRRMLTSLLPGALLPPLGALEAAAGETPAAEPGLRRKAVALGDGFFWSTAGS